MDQLKGHGIKTDLALTGFIKLDPLFNGSMKDAEQLKSDLELDPSKKNSPFCTYILSKFNRKNRTETR